MAGLGRRTHYRKHLTNSVVNDYPIPNPQQHERLAKVVATRGGNQFDVLLALMDQDSSQGDREPQLCILPTKFRKLVFIKRGDFVIVETSMEENAEDDTREEKGVRCIVRHILYKDQIKHLKAKGVWPTSDTEFTDETDTGQTQHASFKPNGSADHPDHDDGIVYDDGYDDELEEDLFVNTNRLANLVVEESSDSEDET
jgi:probable RNA-binding protein EIF1AD